MAASSNEQTKNNNNNKNLVFVYGTLKKGFYNHRLLTTLLSTNDATYISPSTTLKTFPLVIGPHGIPYLVNLPGSGTRVKGELYAVSDHALARLDHLEGVDRGHYERKKVNVEKEEDHVEMEADAYFADKGFGEDLWRKCGEVVGGEFTREMGERYVRREDRPARCSSVNDIRVFIETGEC